MDDKFIELRKIIRNKIQDKQIKVIAAEIGISLTTLREFVYHERNITLYMASLLMEYFQIEVKFIEK